MVGRAARALAAVLVGAMAAAGCGSGGGPGAAGTSTPPAARKDGICALISPATLEKAYGSIRIIRNDQSVLTAEAVHGTCDFLKDETHFLRVFFTMNVNSDPSKQTFLGLSTQPTSKRVSSTTSEVYSVAGGLIRYVGHRNSVTIEVGLRVGSSVADSVRDNTVALDMLEQGLSHF